MPPLLEHLPAVKMADVHPPAVDGYARVAQSVLLAAVHDRKLKGPDGGTARAFLADPVALGWWCELAHMHPKIFDGLR